MQDGNEAQDRRSANPFDPARHLSLINGNEYLEVKWRIAWFRSEFPEGRIETFLISHENGESVMKAEVTAIRDGGVHGFASDYGSEDAQSFGDYLEKSSTKAIGRALAALGFGTQFCTDFEFGAATGRVVDSPVAARSGATREGQVPANYSGTPARGQQGTGATEKQLNLIHSLARDARMDIDATNQLAVEQTGHDVENLTRRDASTLIDYLQERRKSR